MNTHRKLDERINTALMSVISCFTDLNVKKQKCWLTGMPHHESSITPTSLSRNSYSASLSIKPQIYISALLFVYGFNKVNIVSSILEKTLKNNIVLNSG